MSLWPAQTRWDKFIVSFPKRPWLSGTVLIAVPVIAGFCLNVAIEGASAPIDGWRIALGLACLVALVLVSLIQWAIGERGRRLLDREGTSDVCKRVLALMAEICGYPNKHVRTNIMVAYQAPSGELKRRVDDETAFNFSPDDPDRRLELEALGGVSGLAWLHKRPHVAEVANMAEQMTPEQRALVRRTLTTVLSVPIAVSPDRLLGTLQADSDLPLKALGWEDEQLISRAQQCADLISLHFVEKANATR